MKAEEVIAGQWLEDANRHLDAAQAIADLDPSGSYVLASHAARKSVAAALLMTGHRLRRRTGSDQALAQFATTQSDD